MEHQRNQDIWRDRVIVGTIIGATPPAWMASAYEAYRAVVLNPAYPCFYGTQSERLGDIYYSYVDDGCLHHLPETLRTFLAIGTISDRKRRNMALFLDPRRAPRDHEEARAQFWDVLAYLRDHDRQGAATSLDADHPLWEFSFGGSMMFVVGASPTYLSRHSRNLGDGMVLLFQPREVFIDPLNGRPIEMEARARIRERLQAWDGMAAHPDLGVYGDPSNREWRQYFLPDDNQPVRGQCPFAHGPAARPADAISERSEKAGVLVAGPEAGLVLAAKPVSA
ncbi:hypothetical protein FBZ89_12421 [Nitrospirillum amazonense]|uniref:YqcI/YcgG family protein n=1 Tax=Nitrospirillum amazonense TaxID=28077 RepID=A0A560ESR4_9PROT|nr:YqcI/YcgG family protein [Nitrospirillum amazonense]TWB12408.1 hypothetical protein FBZ89_12421 [Nitrospirillum amazonense]